MFGPLDQQGNRTLDPVSALQVAAALGQLTSRDTYGRGSFMALVRPERCGIQHVCHGVDGW
jgi:hypothetical protein